MKSYGTMGDIHHVAPADYVVLPMLPMLDLHRNYSFDHSGFFFSAKAVMPIF